VDNSSAKPSLPRVSVIIAVYNNSQYLHDAIKSAIYQDYPELDIWVVDDCSTENLHMDYPVPTHGGIILPFLTERKDEVKDSYKAEPGNNRNLYYLRLCKNGGPSRARNIAIANALRNGSHLIQVLDSDDVMYPTKVSTLLKPIMLDPERVAISYADYHIQSEDGSIRYESKLPYDFSTLFGGTCIIHSGSLISSLALRNLLPMPYPEDLRVTEDFSLWRSILRNNQWVACHVSEPLTLVRSHKDDSTNSVKKEIWEDCFRKTMSRT